MSRVSYQGETSSAEICHRREMKQEKQLTRIYCQPTLSGEEFKWRGEVTIMTSYKFFFTRPKGMEERVRVQVEGTIMTSYKFF